jgi:hypothetical protein
VIRAALFVAVNITVLLLMFALLEGAASLVIVAKDGLGEAGLAERQHTEYDADLGWINRPNVSIPDMYGPGRALHTNSLRFRSRAEFRIEVPTGKRRAVCSGDSFTLGYGVDDSETWCQLLEQLDPGLETVNMGQGGYGVDQAYLWYERDGGALEHDIHLFAFITPDFDRMMDPVFLGYPKPLLRVSDGELVVTNVPVPNGVLAELIRGSGRFLPNLRIHEFAVRLRRRSGLTRDNGGANDRDLAREIAALIVEDLVHLSERRGTRLALVHLPRESDYLSPASGWEDYLRGLSEEQGATYMNLNEEFRDLPPGRIRGLFIPPGEIEFLGAAGHYTVEGNRFVAQALLRRLADATQASGAAP